MAYDENLAQRVRTLLADEESVREKRMFGGLAFLVAGHMSVAAISEGGLMVRVDPERTEAFATRPHARVVEMRGRPIDGWVRVDAEGLRTEGQLEEWVRRGVACARSLAPRAESGRRALRDRDDDPGAWRRLRILSASPVSPSGPRRASRVEPSDQFTTSDTA